jgi:hypothetical protein
MIKVNRRPRTEPPYTRYAALNPYNLTVLAGAAFAALATGDTWIAVCASAAEAVWLLYAPDSPILRRLWFDRMWEAEGFAAKDDARTARLAILPDHARARVAALFDQKKRIGELARDNRSFGAEMLQGELDQIEALVDEFIELGVTATHCERHLASFDLLAMRRAWDAYNLQVEALPKRDLVRSVAEKNLEVLAQRRARHEDLGRALGAARGQMELIENTFRLLADEIVTMGNPAELGRRLDDLRIAVDAIRETTHAVDGDDPATTEIAEPARADRRMNGGRS